MTGVASTDERFSAAIAAIDDANREDPTTVTVRGRRGPKELLHAELVTEWVERLAPGADPELLLAARGHHLRRWTVPRSTYPAGRAGYLRWRRDRHAQHAAELGEILRSAGYDDATVGRVGTIVRKDDLTDRATQTLEDALCLVFLETQLADVAARLDPDRLARVLTRTLAKMSPAGRTAVEQVPLDPDQRVLLARAARAGAD